MTNYTFTTIDDPLGPTPSSYAGINDAGQVVGSYIVNGTAHGFLYSGGTYTALPDDPSAKYLHIRQRYQQRRSNLRKLRYRRKLPPRWVPQQRRHLHRHHRSPQLRATPDRRHRYQ